jgi:hypothetical protein
MLWYTAAAANQARIASTLRPLQAAAELADNGFGIAHGEHDDASVLGFGTGAGGQAADRRMGPDPNASVCGPTRAVSAAGAPPSSSVPAAPCTPP